MDCFLQKRLQMMQRSATPVPDRAFEDAQQDTRGPGTLIGLLKACARHKSLNKGSRIHAAIVRKGLLEKSTSVGNALINMYAKCGSLEKAKEVCGLLPAQNVVSWNALIAGYAQHGHGEQALQCFEQMRLEGIYADAITLVCILKACGSIGAATKGQDIHAEIVREGLLEKDVIAGNALVDMYAKCGLLAKAQEVCDNLPTRNVVTWNTLITGYTQQGHGGKALKCFELMQVEGLFPDVVTFVCVLKACGSIGAIDKGQELHADIVRGGFLIKELVVGNALVDMYAKCGVVATAQEVCDKLPVRDVVSWNALITGYAHHGPGEQALKCFERMQHEGLSPNRVTFICMLKACASIGAADRGRELHAEIAREGLLEKDSALGTALVDMYSKCGQVAKAQEVFDKLPIRNSASWNALITGYTQHGHGEQALNCFERMQLEGLSPDVITFLCALKACGSIGAADKGQEIHAEIVRQGLLENDITVGTALVDMYAKCGLVAKAQEVCDNIQFRNVVLWSALIIGYVQHGQGEKALECFDHMLHEGHTPDAITFASILKACGSIGAIDKGQELHTKIVKEGFLQKDAVVGTALVDMYIKCGLLAKAQEVFDALPARNVVLWSALIAGYGLLGKADDVFYSFDKMIAEGIEPDLVTFTIVLNACSHTGSLERGEMYFKMMRTVYGFIPTLEHHACMVDLFSRAGHLDKAIAVIKEMPFPANLTMWYTVLGGCRKWRNLKLGVLAFERALELDEKDAAAYVCMINIYADAGRQEDADKVEAMRVRNQAWKKPGCTWLIDQSSKMV